MIFSEALFDDAQASLKRTSNRRFALKSSPLIPFVHCLAGRAGQVRPNYSLESTLFTLPMRKDRALKALYNIQQSRRYSRDSAQSVKGHMRNFVVFVQGENFNLEVDGKFQPAGFFASRRIEAKTEEEASSVAIAQLLKEPELEGKALHDYSMIVKVAHEMPLDHKNTYSGFTLYRMEDV